MLDATLREETELGATSTPAVRGWGVLECFIISQTALPALLYFPGTQAIRVPIRMAPFALSLAGLAWWLSREAPPGQAPPHPARPWLVACAAYLTLSILHPNTNSPLAGLAQTALYVSVLAPVIWVPQLVSTPAQIQRILGIVLVSCGINSAVGILQVYDPGRWLPQEFSSVVVHSYQGVLAYVGPTGEHIVRPPGLSDNPGAVCGPGMIAAFLGLYFFARPVSWLWRGASLAISFAGITAVYLSQVRTALLVAAGMCVVYAVAVALQQRKAHATAFLGIAAAVVGAAFVVAVLLGGESVGARFATLSDDPQSVYYASGRGEQLEDGFARYLTNYPFGAGLGRWGMMRTYFGDPSNPDSPPLWAELQMPAWILDGGVVLLLLYGVALVKTARHELRLVRSATGEVASMAAVVFAINAGTLALVFGFAPFTNQVGLQFWFLAGAISGLAHASRGSTCETTS